MPWKKMLAQVSGNVDEQLLAQNQYLIEENRVLRNQLSGRPNITEAERRTLAEKALAMGELMADTVTIVTPETMLKWQRQLIARKFDGSKQRKKSGRPPISNEIVRLIIDMAKDNPTWGYDRIAGALGNLGHTISDQSVGNILKQHGLAPSPERRRNTTWANFIRRHKEVIWATDFLTTEVWTKAGLTTFYVLFFIHLKTRRIVLGGITTSPNEAWMKQIARNLTGWDEPMLDARYLIHDRDTKYTDSFGEIFRSVGIKPLKLPARSPNLNAFAERFVKSIKTECLDQMILFGEKSLRHCVREYVAHYHAERNHQGIKNTIPFPDERLSHTGKVTKSERLGGLLKFYHRKAA